MTENKWLEFRTSGIHGMGAFARVNIRAGVRLIEYVGEKIDKAESLKRCEAENYFIFTLTDEHDIDGSMVWNPARLINHSCEPNCEAVLDEEQIWIDSKRAIKAGEEISFNYGYELSDYRDHPCACRAAACVKFIVAEEFLDEVRKREANRSEYVSA